MSLPEAGTPVVTIVDYGLGNLFSLKHACEHVGLRAVVSSSREDVLGADAVILPGVGAFGDAMNALERLDLVAPLQEIAASSRPLLGICLGMQLLMSESFEFGQHAGLGIVPGQVLPLTFPGVNEAPKVPQVAWNHVYIPGTSNLDHWSGSPLQGLTNGALMYFVHSYYVKPDDSSVVLSVTSYGGFQFCSSLRRGSIFGFQCHPERSGPVGLQVYRSFASLVSSAS